MTRNLKKFNDNVSYIDFYRYVAVPKIAMLYDMMQIFINRYPLKNLKVIAVISVNPNKRGIPAATK